MIEIMENFLFCSHQGQSTVDYLLLNFCDFDTLSHFEILQFNEFSDHAPLSFNFYLKPRNKEHEHLNTQTDPEISRKMVWDNAKIDDFKMLLNNSMDGIHRLTTDINNEPVDDVVKNFTQFLHDKAFDIFGKTYTNRNSSSYHKKQNKKWFDENCKNAKIEFTRARNVFNRNKNDQNRRNFTRSRTKYNRVKHKARKIFKQNEGVSLNDLAKKDSRKFWKNIKLTYKKANTPSNSLNIDQLHEHFQKMFGDQTEPNQNNESRTEPNVEVNVNGDFDIEFTMTELRSAVFSQNNNKTPGMDSIPSEII